MQRLRLLFAHADQLTKLDRDKLALADWKQLVDLLPESPEKNLARQRLAATEAKLKSGK
jgi:hypothetical protein